MNSVMWLPKKKKKGAITGYIVSSSKEAMVRENLTLISIFFYYAFLKGRHNVDHHILIP